MKTILGVSAFYHDSAAALVQDGTLVAAAQEERFTRKKHSPDFPVNAIKYCLEYSGCRIDELDAVVFYDKPLLKFERLLETYYTFAPRGLRSFLSAMPVWMKEKLFFKKMLSDGLADVEAYDRKKLRLLFSEHHFSHAASAFYPSPYAEAAILSIDGVGEWATASICQGQGSRITMRKEMRFPHSVGLLYSAFTYYLGFRVNSGEYKLMGLAPYGNPAAPQTKEFIRLITDQLVSIKDDGSIWLNQEYFNYATGLTMVVEKKWEKLFGMPAVAGDGRIEQKHCNLAYAIQKVTEDIVFKMAAEAKRITGADNLCLSGGVALNCVANGRLVKENIFKDIFIQPAAGDAGGALGAAYMAYYGYFENQRTLSGAGDLMQGAYLGPDFSDKEIERVLKKYKAAYARYDDFAQICALAAGRLAAGDVVGWFQGRMEYGPRALGNRSIVGDARNLEMQKKMNLKIKYREGFRPFAPAVLAEDAQDFFDLPVDSPYMLLVAPLRQARRKPVPEGYAELDIMEKLYIQRSDVPAITHVDFSARVQTVHQQTNARFWQLLRAFKAQTGYGLLVNTSFNVRGEPVVCTPEDAYACFMRTEMDYLVVGNFVLKKNEQPDWQNRGKWIEKFKAD
ncbi:MAG: carbamoyltransferase [Candidatus Omnitrophica bacterium]|nr:carbamoyltransferase [Candidatus Omnitrophota bacterium]